MFERIKRLLGFRDLRRSDRGDQRIRARYDATLKTAEAQRAWSGADNFAANAANSPENRRLLRMRGRYEQFNNPYTDGQLQTLSGDVVGQGPRLRMLTGVKKIDKFIEKEFQEWMRVIGLANKLRLMIETPAAAGEVFGVMFQNPKLKTAVKLDLRLYEGDQISTPGILPFWDPTKEDGIEFDSWENPTVYHLLNQHPGDARSLAPLAFTTIPAERVIHVFKQRRPGQRRGIPRITSSLPLYNQRRAYRESVVTASKVAAELGAVLLESQAVPDEETSVAAAGDTMDIERGMMTTLPEGYRANQMKAEQPATTFKEFDNKLIAEGARPLNMPFNIAAADSSGYNYSSGRLDHQTYDLSVGIDRGDLEGDALFRLLTQWLEEALTIPGYLPFRARAIIDSGFQHEWLWHEREHVDQTKAADAQKTRLESGTTTLSYELAKNGVDFETHLETLKGEIEAYAALGLVHPVMRDTVKQQTKAAPANVEEEEGKEEEKEVAEEDAANASVRRNGSAGGRLVGLV